MYCTRKINADYTWVGADCRRLALFEGVFGVPDGVSFNSYLLMDEKTVLFDTVDNAVRTTFRENVTHALAGRTPDYLVVHHMEPDHAAEMADMARLYPDMTILCSAAAKNMIAQFFDAELAARVTVVKEGDTLCTGRHTLRFIAAPTYNGGVFITMDELLRDIASHGLQNRRFALLENGTWAPVTARQMAALIEPLKGWQQVGAPVTIRSAAHEAQMQAVEQLTAAISGDISGENQ